jgi:quercetin dioxygenase-like cupin family protein
MKRLALQQGELAQFWDESEPILYLAAMELRLGGTRGNHFHRKKRELTYVVSGAVRLHVKLVDAAAEKRPEQIWLRAGDLASIQPGIAHAYEPLETGFAIEFSPSAFEPEDTIRCVLI